MLLGPWIAIDATMREHVVVCFDGALDLHVYVGRAVAELVARRTGKLVRHVLVGRG